MSSKTEKTSPDTVPGLGFKDKEKALETLSILEGRDPDYQKLAIKGLLGRAKRTLTLTKAEDKINNIKEAVSTFEKWLENYETASHKLRPYLPVETIEAFQPLKKKYNIDDKNADKFLKAYRSVGGDYKHLRTSKSDAEDEITWDIVRNKNLEKYMKVIEEDTPELWDSLELPTKEHLRVILWGFSPAAKKIKSNKDKIEDAIKKSCDHKRSSGKRSSSEEDEESPSKKSKK